MLTVIIGFASDSIKSTPTVLYCGQAGDAMQLAIDTAIATYPRIYRYNLLDRGIPVKNTTLPAPTNPPPETKTSGTQTQPAVKPQSAGHAPAPAHPPEHAAAKPKK